MYESALAGECGEGAVWRAGECVWGEECVRATGADAEGRVWTRVGERTADTCVCTCAST